MCFCVGGYKYNERGLPVYADCHEGQDRRADAKYWDELVQLAVEVTEWPVVVLQHVIEVEGHV